MDRQALFGASDGTTRPDRNNAEEKLRESEELLTKELAATRWLQDVSLLMIREGNVEALYELVLDAAVAIMGSDCASIQRLHPERGPGGELQLLGHRGFNPSAAKFWEWVAPASQSSCGVALRTGERVIVPDVRTCDFMAGSDDLETLLQTGILAVQTTPLLSRGGQVLGMISTHWSQPHQPSERDLGLLDVLARQAADLIERSQAEAALRQSEADARFLAALGERIRLARDAEGLLYEVSRSTGDYLDIRHCFFAEVDEANDRGLVRRDHCRGAESAAGEYRISEYSPAARAEIAAGRIIINCDSREDPRTAATYEATYGPRGERAYVAVPLMRDGRWEGTFWVSTDEPRRWQAREVALLETVAERTWNAVEKLIAEEALREANRRKDEFLAMLAHELRNPLAPILNAVEVLRIACPEDGQQQWAREVIQRQTQHLTRLVDDLLDVSRITRGKVNLRRGPLELSAVIRGAVEASCSLIDARRHELKITLPPEPVRVEGDLTRLVQVVSNLLNNAAKFTDEGGHIQLEAGEESGEAVIRVRDNGIGLPADLLPHVFEPFRQADRSLDRAHGGLGIGLTLVRQLVELHGGRVEARSEGPGRGSEFLVRLPVHVPAAVPSSEVLSGERTRSAAPSLRILIVEDSVDAAETLALLLYLRGHEVRTAGDGPAGLNAAHAFRPHVILCDIGLPGMSGYEVAERLRKQADFTRTPLIAISGYGQEEDLQRSHEAGFDLHLTKPVEPDTLAALLYSLPGLQQAPGAGAP
jgi:signal transduction histidine kinase/CheY-like chemotaxis protein